MIRKNGVSFIADRGREQNDQHFANIILKGISVNENIWTLNKIKLLSDSMSCWRIYAPIGLNELNLIVIMAWYSFVSSRLIGQTVL